MKFNRHNSLQDSKALEGLKNQIGFGTAVKLTLGFYVGQFIATLLGLGIITLVIAGIYLAYKVFGES